MEIKVNGTTIGRISLLMRQFAGFEQCVQCGASYLLYAFWPTGSDTPDGHAVCHRCMWAA